MKLRNDFQTVFTILLMFVALFLLAPATATAQGLTDASISEAVAEEILDDPIASLLPVEVMTDDGVVTLSGRASNILEKRRATRLAESIRGVRSVVNQITIVPQARSDDEIRENVRAALAQNAATDSYAVSVSVERQVVTLTGTADSWQERELAGKVAGNVLGVLEVNNEIDVTYDMIRPDSEIADEINQALLWDTLVDGSMIDVNVDGGEVTLSGIVGSAAEKRRAIYDAWVAGVTDVDSTDLTVERWARDADLREGKYADKSDTAVEAAVSNALHRDPRVELDDVTVSAADGVVTLSGKVDHVTAKRAATQTARNTVGVWRVKNRLTIDTEGISDSTIEQNVASALARNAEINRFHLDIEVVDGVVYLTGTVDNHVEKAIADDTAASTEGVIEVKNNVTIHDDDEFWTYDPYLYDVYIYEYDWYDRPTTTTTRNDWEIEEDINDELWWSPFVDSDEVTVTVDNGVATLTGTVETWSEYQAASENAYEGGAVSVDNNLVVAFGPDYYSG